jgi:hypothetical protein
MIAASSWRRSLPVANWFLSHLECRDWLFATKQFVMTFVTECHGRSGCASWRGRRRKRWKAPFVDQRHDQEYEQYDPAEQQAPWSRIGPQISGLTNSS